MYNRSLSNLRKKKSASINSYNGTMIQFTARKKATHLQNYDCTFFIKWHIASIY